ncbi:uncharacterized protein A4U43_C02F2650 [Asparagus officinalis]|uniref:Fe2OG dioxygenase domain-containing protein n=1 Tax=Asparagus officinalis TaxID=4686 RepID=A0A5P1FI15_ASPOF|nr:uncharacterized protein A4U43_C02F2650 [Asparagus officinalis]
MKAISDACKEWGFFQVINHGVSLDLVAKMRTVWREFFHLPVEAKKKLANSPKTYEGYGSRLGVEKGAILDWGDYYFLHVLPEHVKNYDKWPANPESCREITEEYGRDVVKLCGTLMKVLSISLGLDVGYLQKAFGGDEVGACIRVNYYPKCPQPDLTLGLSAHSDPGVLTIVLADDRVKGLQVRKGNAWVNVQPEPNAFIVNIGDQMQGDGQTHTAERFCVVLFYNPRSDLPLFPARELVTTERPQLYQPMTFNEYRLYIRKRGPKGKTQVESLKAIDV